jgi:hypothetical protein
MGDLTAGIEFGVHGGQECVVEWGLELWQLVLVGSGNTDPLHAKLHPQSPGSSPYY